MPEAFLVKPNLQLQVLAFIVGIPAVMVYECVAANYACSNFCAKLSPGFCLSADNGADVRLEDAQDAVCASVSLRATHVLLLVIHFAYSCKCAFLVRQKAFQIVPVASY